LRKSNYVKSQVCPSNPKLRASVDFSCALMYTLKSAIAIFVRIGAVLRCVNRAWVNPEKGYYVDKGDRLLIANRKDRSGQPMAFILQPKIALTPVNDTVAGFWKQSLLDSHEVEVIADIIGKSGNKVWEWNPDGPWTHAGRSWFFVASDPDYLKWIKTQAKTRPPGFGEFVAFRHALVQSPPFQKLMLTFQFNEAHTWEYLRYLMADAVVDRPSKRIRLTPVMQQLNWKSVDEIESMGAGSTLGNRRFDDYLSDPAAEAFVAWYIRRQELELSGSPSLTHSRASSFSAPEVMASGSGTSVLPICSDVVLIGVRSFGRPEKALATLKLLETALNDADLENTYIFLEDVTSYNDVLAGTRWADRVRPGRCGADGQVNAIAEAAGVGCKAVVLDDNIGHFVHFALTNDSTVKKSKLEDRGYLSHIIRKGFEATANGGTGIWGLYQASFVTRLPHPVKHSAGLIYGACFGFVVTEDRVYETRYGQVKDDLERSLRFMKKHGGNVTRLMEYAVIKRDAPGTFKEGVGGISGRLGNAEAHSREAGVAIQQLLDEFPEYIQLPKQGCKKPPPLGVFFKKVAETDEF
jgi:hypothetical protein